MSITVWWRTVKRACQIHGIFELLRGQKSKEQKTLTERYASLVKEQVVMSFRQAARYDRLGKFLKQFPLFVYQRKWVTWADWFQNVSGMVLIDCLPSIAPLSSVFFRDCFQLHAAGFQVRMWQTWNLPVDPNPEGSRNLTLAHRLLLKARSICLSTT